VRKRKKRRSRYNSPPPSARESRNLDDLLAPNTSFGWKADKPNPVSRLLFTVIHGDKSILKAAREGDHLLLGRLVRKGGNPDFRDDKEGYTPLMYAVVRNSTDLVRILLGTGRVDLESRDDKGWTALHHAASQNSVAVIELLLETLEIDVNASNQDGATPLILAVGNGNEAVVRSLLAIQRTDVDAKDTKYVSYWIRVICAPED
jgi:ankyrin repeat protein